MNLGDLHIGALLELYQHMPGVYFFAKDSRLRFIMVNANMIERCGVRDEAALLGKSDPDFFPPDRAASYNNDDRYVISTGRSIIDKVELAPEHDNTVNWFITTKVPLRSHRGRIVGLAGIARDLNKAITSLAPYSDMAAAIKYISEHYSEPIEVRTLAELSHLSVSQFERKFRKAFQLSPVKHIMNIRINAAKQLLATAARKISSIAQDTGFYDHSHFTREFIRHTGTTPTGYRQKMAPALARDRDD